MEFDDLPDGWKQWRFDDALQIRKGAVDPAQFPDEQFHLFSIPAHDVGDAPEVKFGREIGSSKTAVEPGDCLFSKLNPRIPRTWIVPNSTGSRQIASTEFWPVRSKHKPGEDGYLAAEFIQWLFRYADFLDGFRGDLSGGVQSRQRLKQDVLSEVIIPVPPLDEQRRLVRRIEALTTHLAQAREARQAATAEAKAAQAAALAAAFVGDDDWTDTTLGEVCAMKTGKTPPTKQPEYFDGDVPFVCPADISGPLRIMKAARTLTRRAITEGKANLFPRGTVLLVGIGSTVGKVGIADAELCTNQQITGLTFNAHVLPNFSAWFLVAQRAVIENAASDGGVPIINQNGMGQLAFRFPPDLDEQRRIVASLDALAAKQAELGRLQAEVEGLLAAFTPALLAKAFCGEL
jgi:type I restriction enzyme S subunit